MTLEVFVSGIPVPQGSVRGFVRNGRAIVTSDNPALRSWRQDVTTELANCREVTTLDPVDVRLEFFLPRPRSHFGRRGLLPSAPAFPGRKPDLDKLVRGVADAATVAGVWVDDAQVVSIRATKRYACPDQTPGVFIKIADSRP